MELDYLKQVFQEGPLCCFVKGILLCVVNRTFISFVDELPRANGYSHV